VTNHQESASVINQFRKELQEELQTRKQELADIELKINQSMTEVTKLTQKNATMTGQLQRLQTQIERISKEDLKANYVTALDAQQRLLLMRGQLEKIQSDQVNIKILIGFIESVLETVNSAFPEGQEGNSQSSASYTIEMIIQAQEAERQRLSRQMHDGPAQALSNFILQTEIAMRLFDIDQEKAREELFTLKNSATTTFQKVRDFIFDLRPMMLDDLGLVPTLKRYIDVFHNQPGCTVGLSVTGRERRLESFIEVMIFRAIQELLGNALRHSQASQVKVHLDMGESNIKVNVNDNGKGFDINILDEPGNMGIKVIRDRIEMIGGEFEVNSTIGEGTQVYLQIPAMEMAHLT